MSVKLVVSLYGSRVGDGGDAAVDAQCKCLRTLSPILVYLEIDVPTRWDIYVTLIQAITTLKCLPELRLYRLRVDMGMFTRNSRSWSIISAWVDFNAK